MAGETQITQEERCLKRRLHNFILPSKLKWGNQKHLRCDKSTPTNNPQTGNTEIQVVRENLINDFRVATHRLKLTILDEKKGCEEDLNSLRPWNLRKRRAACKAPIDVVMANEKPTSPLRKVDSRLRSVTVAEINNGQRVKFSSVLTKSEIEKDILAITGAKPHRRPKKRPRIVQRQLDAISPGMWLTEVTAEMYKVEENGDQAN